MTSRAATLASTRRRTRSRSSRPRARHQSRGPARGRSPAPSSMPLQTFLPRTGTTRTMEPLEPLERLAPAELDAAAEVARRIAANVARAVHARQEVLDDVLIAL